MLFLIALVIATVSAYMLSYNNTLERATRQAEKTTRSAALGTLGVMDAFLPDDNLKYLDQGAEFREDLHQIFRFLCQSTNLRYLYLYTIGTDGYRHYIITAANTDEDDLRLQTEFGYGSVRDTALYQAEKNVLNRSKDEDYELVDNNYGWVCMCCMPVLDDNNNIIALIGADYDMENIELAARMNLRRTMLHGLIVIALAIVISLILIRHSVIKPILALSQRMRCFAGDRKIITYPDRRKTIYEDEITDIENAFDTMTKDITQSVQDIEALTREQVYHQTQLDVARKIQDGMVPGECSFSGEQFELNGYVEPAKDVGGDFYDVFHLDDRRICAVIGDSSGKGISAALFMAVVKTSIREKLIARHSLSDALNLVNRELCDSNPENMFVTAFALILDTETGIVTFANAGHNRPLILGRNPFYLDVMSGIALGLFETSDIVDQQIVLPKGTGILLYTDGISEAIDTGRQPYGEDRLRETVLSEYQEDIHSYEPEQLIHHTVASVHDYAKGLEQFDDITCLALVYKGNGSEEKVLTPDFESFDTVKNTILSALGKTDCALNIVLACEEIFTNIVNYSGADQILFSWKRVGDTWLTTFTDNGPPFDPVSTTRNNPDFEDLDQGGMGILFARSITRNMIYSRIDDRNVLTMVFDVIGGIME